MSEWWDKQIHRADQLGAQPNGSKELLTFYAQLLRAQKNIYDYLRGRKDWLPSGDLESDWPVLSETLPKFLEAVETYGPSSLAAEARDLSATTNDVVAERLITYWRSGSDLQFFEKALLQPYLKWLAESDGRPLGREIAPNERHCPFCGGNPQVSFLQNKETTAESGNRDLICATCLSSWEFRRVASSRTRPRNRRLGARAGCAGLIFIIAEGYFYCGLLVGG